MFVEMFWGEMYFCAQLTLKGTQKRKKDGFMGG